MRRPDEGGDGPGPTDDAARDATVRTAFPCRLCGGRAATIWLAPRGSPDPEAGSTGSPSVGVEYARIGIEAGPLSVTIGGEVVEHAVPAIRAALTAREAAALFGAGPEFAPFWCPECAASYCGHHWLTWLVFDPDFPGWLDEQRGICPRGHERMISD